VVIDDFLPVDSNNKLIFDQATDNGDLWVAFLEKGLAKFYGSYSKLETLTLSQAWRLLLSSPARSI